MTKSQWQAVISHINLGSQLASQHDAAFVLVAVGEVQCEPHPKTAWVTSGVTDETSLARSEATIAMLEHAAQELKKAHIKRFGKEPQHRGYKSNG